MRYFSYITAFSLAIATQLAPLSYAMESYVISEETTLSQVRFNNENWFTLPHPKIASFSILADGSAFGTTETGVSFSQYNVPNALGLRIQRFEIQDHYHYILDGTPIYTFTELSARLAEAVLSTDAT